MSAARTPVRIPQIRSYDLSWNGLARNTARTVPRRRRRSESMRYPRRRRLVIGFTAGLVVAIGALMLLAFVVGHGHDVGLGGFAEAVLRAATAPGTGVVVAFAILLVIAWCFRHLWLEQLAWRPGRVEVPDFASPANLADVDAKQLTALFRQRLATLRLQSPAPVPGTAPDSDFIEVLGRGSVDSRNLLGTLVSLLRAAKPTHAYEVRGILVERDDAPRCCVTVQVLRLPDQGTPPETIRDTSWELAVRRAADWATAQILPRTRRCTTPWASWRGFVMPTGLVEAYEHAVELELQRRYDQALARYFDALKLDPKNLDLRLHVGLLQEKLGLFLDAFATYEGMIKVTDQARDQQPRGFYRRHAERERNRTLLICRYRRAVLLGGDALAAQWRYQGGEPPNERDEQRTSLRERLGVELRSRHRELLEAVEPERTGREPLERLLAADLPRLKGPKLVRDRFYYELRELFALIAQADMPGIEACIRKVQGRWWPRPTPPPVSAKGLALTRLCIEERLSWVRKSLGMCTCAASGPSATPGWIWSDAGELIRAVEAVGTLDSWHEHYNAACALALPLLVERHGGRDRERDKLAQLAVEHLQLATACADSAFIATRRDWLISEDPDLDGLRTHPFFKAFEALYFPAGRMTPRRPSHVQKLEGSRYSRDLVRATAARWEAIWHDRAAVARRRPTVQELLRWWETEALLWGQLGRIAFSHRHWRARLEFIRTIDRCSSESGRSPLEVCFVRYEDEPLKPPRDGDIDRCAEQVVDHADERLDRLGRLLSASTGASCGPHRLPGVDEWLAKLRQLTHDRAGTPPSTKQLTDLCELQTALWARLGQWFHAELDDGTVPAKHFETSLGKVREALQGA